MNNKNNTIEIDFFAGKYRAVIEQCGEPADFSSNKMPYFIGALAFSGHVGEAIHHFNKSNLTGISAISARFFLAIACTRHSEYAEARKYLAQNIRAARSDGTPLADFYAAQGLGFYRFFCGRLRLSLAYSRRALFSAMDARFDYGRFLAIDLTGHSMIQSGAIYEGIGRLNEALQLARRFGNGSMADATEIGIACYEAQFGHGELDDLANRLDTLLETLSAQNTYSRATLLLEAARLATLRGNMLASRRYRDEGCRVVYTLNHRRQSAALNHRHAYELFLSGEYAQALNMVRVARTEIHPEIDLMLDLQISGLQRVICKRIGLNEEFKRLTAHVNHLTRRTGSYLAQRILDRDANNTAQLVNQDRIGDLLDRKNSQSGLRALLVAGCLTPIRSCLGLNEGERALIAFSQLSECLIWVDPPSIGSSWTPLSRQQRAFLNQLARGEQTKEALVRTIWGYRYDSLRHDRLIYQAATRLRTALGERANWLEFTGNVYRLSPGVRLIASQEKRNDAPPEKQIIPATESNDLGSRGAAILSYLEENGTIDPRRCMDLFDITRVTASRDLARLLSARQIRRLGGGRSTRYELIKQKIGGR